MVYNIGHMRVGRDVIDNQIIHNDEGDEGYYYSEYDGHIYSYWYE